MIPKARSQHREPEREVHARRWKANQPIESRVPKMTTATTIPERTSEAEGDQCVVLQDVDWTGYSTLLRVRGEKSIPRMVYLDGGVFLMSPSFSHERLKELLGLFVMVLVEELDLPCIAAGSTTFRRRKTTRRSRGRSEPIISRTWIESAARRRSTCESIRLPISPSRPWHTHDPDEAVEVYRRFGCPRSGSVMQNQLTILTLQPNGHYVPVRAEPRVPQPRGQPRFTPGSPAPRMRVDTAWIKELRRWVAEVLLPRHRDATK